MSLHIKRGTKEHMQQLMFENIRFDVIALGQM